MVGFAQQGYEAFELDRSVEVCLTKSADTAFPITLTLVPMETTNDLPDNVIAAAICKLLIMTKKYNC